jgi:hypothetical protein
MFERLKNWLAERFSDDDPSAGPLLRETGAHVSPNPEPKAAKKSQAVPRRQPEFVEIDPHVSGEIEDNGPGKNVLIRNKYLREETGTHETLKILDDSLVDSGEETGIDPYNTGGFDRSRNWDKRFRN